MCIYMKNNRAKFHPDPIWNVRALGFFEKAAQQEQKKKNNNNKMSSDMRSVPNPKSKHFRC